MGYLFVKPAIPFATLALLTTACRPADLEVASGPPKIDMAVTGVPGGSLRLGAWTVRNRGGQPTGAPVIGSYHLSADPTITPEDLMLKGLATPSLAGLGPGEAHTFDGDPQVAIPEDLEPGTYYFGIIVDRTNLVAESDESNNTVAVRIGIVRPPS